MKILHLTGEPEDVGGITSVIRNLQTATQAWGWHHAVWVNHAYVELRRPPLSYRTSRHLWSDSPSHIFLLLRSFRAFFELRRLLAAEKFDVIHAHTRGAFLVALGLTSCLGQDVLFTNHSYARRTRMYRRAATLPRFHTVVLTPSMARHYGLAENPPKISIISACFADRFLEEPLVIRRPPSDQRPIRLVGIGNIMRWKNWRLIALALAQMTDEERRQIEFRLWGPTPSDPDSQKYDGELRRLVREHQLEDRFLFRGSTQAVSDCLRQADWFVLPSTNEPCSVALMEALALGVPGIVSASGGNVDILQPGKTGLLFQPDDPSDLAAQFRSLLLSQVRLPPPEEIRETVRARSACSVAAKYRAIYETLAARRKS